MWSFLAKTAIVAAIPKAIDEIHNFIFGEDKPKEVVNKRVTRPYKPRDTTKFTQCMYDYVVQAHSEWRAHNKANRDNKISMEDFVAKLNEVLKLDKSHTAYGNIWNKKVNRDDLIPGTQYFDW